MTETNLFDADNIAEPNQPPRSSEPVISEPITVYPDFMGKQSDDSTEKLQQVCRDLGVSKPEDLINVVVQWAQGQRQSTFDERLTQIQHLLDQSVSMGIITPQEAANRLERKRRELQKPPLLDAILTPKEQETLYTVLIGAQRDLEQLNEELRKIVKLFFGGR